MALLTQPPTALCLLRLSSIGDVCHAVAVVQAIQRHWPDCRLTWVIGRLEAALLEGLPNVELVVFDKSQGMAGYTQLHNQMKARSFDALLHMQVALRASVASRCIPAKLRIGFDRSRAIEGQWLFTNRHIEAQQYPHVLEGFKGFARALGVPDFQPSWHMPLGEADCQWATGHIGEHDRALVICPAASKPERNWTVDGYAQMAQYAHRRGMMVMLCGGPTALEQSLAEAIIARADVPIDNLVGKTSLKQLLALLSRACLVLTPDTGPAHMAVTVGTPVLGLYAHSNPRRTGPYLFPHYVINHYDRNVQAQYGKPWEALPWGTRAKGSDLMAQIEVDEVKGMFDRILEREVMVGDFCGTSYHRPPERPEQEDSWLPGHPDPSL